MSTPRRFTPYYNYDIGEMIASASDEQIVNSIAEMQWNQLLAVREHLKATCASDPGFENSREATLTCKCVICRAEFLKSMGCGPQPMQPMQPMQPAQQGGGGLFDLVYEGMVGYIVADEFCRRVGI